MVSLQIVPCIISELCSETISEVATKISAESVCNAVWSGEGVVLAVVTSEGLSKDTSEVVSVIIGLWVDSLTSSFVETSSSWLFDFLKRRLDASAAKEESCSKLFINSSRSAALYSSPFLSLKPTGKFSVCNLFPLFKLVSFKSSASTTVSKTAVAISFSFLISFLSFTWYSIKMSMFVFSLLQSSNLSGIALSIWVAFSTKLSLLFPTKAVSSVAIIWKTASFSTLSLFGVLWQLFFSRSTISPFPLFTVLNSFSLSLWFSFVSDSNEVKQ